MYAGAIFIQQSLNLDLYLATTGLLAITAVYTIAGTAERGAAPGRRGRGRGPPRVLLAGLRGSRALRSFAR